MNKFLKVIGWKDEYDRWDHKEIGYDVIAIVLGSILIGVVMGLKG